MPQVLLKTGELREIPDDELLTFLQENKELIQAQKGRSRRKAIKSELATNTKQH